MFANKIGKILDKKNLGTCQFFATAGGDHLATKDVAREKNFC
jgi:hypothetical protein